VLAGLAVFGCGMIFLCDRLIASHEAKKAAKA
jgi:hypothetical protein